MTNSLAHRNRIAKDSGTHLHDFSQIMIGWKGEMVCEFSNQNSSINKGQIAIAPGQAEHLYNGRSEDSEVLVIDVIPSDPFVQALEQACSMSFNDTLFQQPEFLSLKPETLPLLDYAASQLFNTPAQTSQQVNCQLVSLFLTQIAEQFSSDRLPSSHQRLDHTRLNALIDQRLSGPIGNNELAAAMHLSESHFYLLCQRQFQLTPQQYVMVRRMQHAKFLLLNSNTPLAILALELGFSDASSFSRAFKKHFQKTPSHMRKIGG